MLRYAIGIVAIGLSSLVGGGNQAGAAEPSYVGRWYVGDASTCKGKKGETQGLVVYTTQELSAYDSKCKIQRAVAKGPGFELWMRCRAEGETSNDREYVEVRDGKLRRTVVVERKPVTFTYPRCP
jgi:hypothetical protein